MKFYISTLGCKVNTYESNVIRDNFLNHGYIESKLEDADVIVINTCSVTNTADHKSMKTVRHARKNNENAIIIVSGCSSQNKKEAYSNMEEVDIVLGNRYKTKITEFIEEYKKDKTKLNKLSDMKEIPFEKMMLNNFNQTRAFVKVQDGCNNYCAYCIIPYVRGDVRSKDLNDCIEEVKTLVQDGKKEIVLTGIHTGNYGRDKGSSLAILLKELVKIEGLERIRISSIEITELDDAFMEIFKTNEKIVSHLHIPLQSGSDKILKEMNRKYKI
jgi:threonylcarbamoyladenosine tRNA methylthiotransferase MtaB